MKVAVISDIHANRQAFEATLEAVAASDAAELWCLGDLVGYGADPDACVELAREHAAVCLAGNHDLAVTGEIPLDEFSRGASLAAQWTREVIAPENLEFLAGLQPAGRGGAGRPLPRQPARSGLGVRALGAARRAVPRRAAPPHLPDRPLATSRSRSCAARASWRPASRGATARGSTSPTGEWLLNPGSVGQPRDGDPRAVVAAARPRRADGLLPAHRLRHRRRRRGDPRGAPARLARRAPGVRSVSMHRRPRRPIARSSSARAGRAAARALLAAALGVRAALLVGCCGARARA